MPGLIIHHWAAIQSQDYYGIAPGCAGHFLLGSLAPDLGYWPGGRHIWSDLSHYIGSTALARVMMKLSNDEPWRSFSLGWLLHIFVDIYGHPAVNHIAANRYSNISDGNTALTYEDYPVAHIRLESGLDLAALTQLDITNINHPKLSFPGEITSDCPLVDAYRICYRHDLELEILRPFVERIPGLYTNFIKWQTRLSRLRVKSDIGKSVDYLIRLILASTLYLSLGRNRGRYAAAMIRPDWPLQTEFTGYLNAIKNGIQKYGDIVTGVSPWPNENFNLDTGKRARRGDYRLADETMDHIIKSNSSVNNHEIFGSDASNVCHWKEIQRDFEGLK